MNSQITEDFLACFRALPDEIKQLARNAYRQWRENSRHPGLHFKQIHARDQIYSVRVSKGWRAVGLLEDGTMTWFWIGSHADYDQLLKQL